jgi:hypothetical protein
MQISEITSIKINNKNSSYLKNHHPQKAGQTLALLFYRFFDQKQAKTPSVTFCYQYVLKGSIVQT